ncbi:MAG: hypothetical protein Q9190_002778 [Brigantiaea leucoxantha]
MLATYYTYSKNDNGGFVISTPEQSFPRHIEGAPRIQNVNAEAWAFAPHAPASLVLTNMWSDPHWHPTKGKPTGSKLGEADVEAAAVRTVCNPSVIELNNHTKSVGLPNLRDYGIWSPNDASSDNYAYISLPANFHNQSSNGNMTTIFLSPGPDMTSVTTGVLILGPRNTTGVRFALACSVDARWNKALHTMVNSNDNSIGNPGNAISAKLRGRRSQSDLKDSTLPTPGGFWRHITAELDGLEAALGYATLFSLGYQPDSIEHKTASHRTTALGSIVLARLKHLAEGSTPKKYWSNNTDAVESVVSTAFADAISRIGIERQQLASSHTPTESVKSCQQISNKYMFCPPPTAAEKSNWTRLEFRGMTRGMEPLLIFENLQC